MRSRLLAVLVTGAAISASWLVSSAGASPQSPATSSATSIDVVDLASGARLLSGRLALAKAPSELRARARFAVSTLAPQVEVATTDVARFGDGDAIVRFDQSHQGLPVIGRGASVRFGADGETKTTALHLESDLPASITPTVAAGEAAKTAQARVGLGVEAKDGHLVVLPTVSGARLAYAFVVRAPIFLQTAPIVMIDAHSGAVLQVRERIVRATAKVYESNPVASPTLATKTLPMAPTPTTDGKLRLQNDFIITKNCIDKKEVKSVALGPINAPMHICSLDQRAESDANGVFDITPVDNLPAEGALIDSPSRTDAFSELSMYYHATRAYEFYRTLQGDPTAQIVRDKPFHTISNVMLPPGIMRFDLATAGNPDKPLEPLQNAMFSGNDGMGGLFKDLYNIDGGAMVFGQGPKRDYSYDGDVVYHEFTHAVVDNTLGLSSGHLDKYGMFDAPGAMNEGLADYFSVAITNQAAMGEYAVQDFAPTAKYMRTADNTDACPGAITGEVHFDATLFSGGLWAARVGLADDTTRAKFDAAIYKAMRANPGSANPGYEDVIKMFLTVLKTDLPIGATRLEAEFTKRGVLPGCDRVFTFTGKAISSPKDNLGRQLGFAAYGKQGLAGATIAPGMLQIKMDVPENTAKVTLSFTPGAAGGGNPLSGGTAFKPVVLAKFGQAITWKAGSKLSHDADVTKDGTATGTDIEVPESVTGATTIYVQIANSGDQEGRYEDVKLTVTAKDPVDVPGGDPAPAETPLTTTTSCACTTAGGSSGLPFAPFALAGLGALVLVARRRRQ